ncbi:MAG: hypothetical protein U9R74_00520 [Pseudomonadota bacterium]|nr:hypothetical protein [Pseudomonadota bacterium]
MSRIVIKDLGDSVDLDQKAMEAISGGSRSARASGIANRGEIKRAQTSEFMKHVIRRRELR